MNVDIKETPQVPGSSGSGAEAPAPRPSVRDSIKAALSEETEKLEQVEEKKEIKPRKKPAIKASEDDEKEEIKDDEVDEQDKEEKKPKKEKEASEDEISDEDQETNSEEQESEAETKQETKAPVEKAHTSLSKEFRDNWTKLPPELRAATNKLAKEASDLKAATGRMQAQYRDLDAAIAPYSQAIQQFGQTPAATVSRLFQWMDALSGQHKVAAFKQLARDFGINLDTPVDNNSSQQQYQPNNQQQAPNVLEQVAPVLQQYKQEIDNLKSANARSSQQATDNIVNNWAGLKPDGTYESKPYFNEVRQIMASYIQNGIVPLNNGNIDLDAAYEMACRAHPQVFEIIQEDQLRARQEAAAAKAKADKAKLAAKKSANVGLKPSAPSIPTSNTVSKKRANGEFPSARESIMNAIQEVRNQ